ncbi:MAG: transposase [Steroidobacteraceae bacterium]|nr:transposase [Pseudomonadota bacterium]MBP6107713.1 transposase [Steroidobacteraceae bacterium]MBP7015155.1 transposase [Steroidobacteraceae bacterium]
MHIDGVPNRTSRPTYLLRESYREGKKVRKRTLANLSALSDEQIDAIRAVLAGQSVRPVEELWQTTRSRAHGAVQAVRVAMQRLGFESLLGSRPSPQRDAVCAMVAARIVAPHTKLATTRWWHTNTLAEEYGVLETDETDLYAAMDWLLERQGPIQKKLAARHLSEGSLALYDLSSSYFEGSCCPLAKIGYSRDGKRNTPQVNYGLLTTRAGCPVAISVYAGNTADASTLMPQVDQLRRDFGLERLVLIGDRGMISHKAIDTLRTLDGLAWITALKSSQIRALVQGGTLQLGLFDQRNLFECSHPDFPGERLMACRNVELGKLRAHKREALLVATEKELEKIRARIDNGSLTGRDKIGVKVGQVLNKYKVGKHFALTIEDSGFQFQRLQPQIAAEAALDGLYVIRTSVPKEQMSSAEAVLNYKALAEVERAFRSMKTIDLHVRPIHHHLETRVRAHIFLCMLAYYVEWHMREAWRELLFADQDLERKKHRDPVAAAKRSDAALAKVATRTLKDGSPVHSFRTLLEDLSTIVRNTCEARFGQRSGSSFQMTTTPNPAQQRALQLLQAITV